MNSVTVVCTIHEEVGPANVSELAAISGSFQPSAIFLEVPEAAMEDFYVTQSRQNLESRAVALYLKDHPAALVPVDIPTPEREFFEDWDYLQSRMRSASSELRRLMSQDRAHVDMYGFRYLNSRYCDKYWSESYDEMRRIIERLNEPRLSDIFVAWQETNSLREEAMVERIQAYCRINNFGKGLFLVGAAHRQPLRERATSSVALESTPMTWDFLAYGE